MNKKQRWSLVIVWMVIIFFYSNQPAVISNEKSLFVIKVVGFLGIDLNSMFAEATNFIVRKTAHLSEYFILYLFVYNALKEEKLKKKTFLLALFIVFLYACSDEFHQIFIPGRAGRIQDVFIDTCGGILALLVTYLTTIRKVNPPSSIGSGNYLDNETSVGVKSPSEVVKNSIEDDALRNK